MENLVELKENELRDVNGGLIMFLLRYIAHNVGDAETNNNCVSSVKR